jgi:RNA polymerase sigma factor (sigma-70 family)
MKLANATAKTPHQNAARKAAIIQNLDLVNKLARRLRPRVPPCVTLDDLISAGTIGLIGAVDRFDASRGLKFRSYAQHRIMGAMLDFLRGQDPLSRAERRRVRESADPLQPPVTVSLDGLPNVALSRLTQTGVADFAIRSDMRAARQCLSARENRVVALLYDLDWRSRDVATVLQVNESRVSQIKRSALSKLRRYFQNTGPWRAVRGGTFFGSHVPD